MVASVTNLGVGDRRLGTKWNPSRDVPTERACDVCRFPLGAGFSTSRRTAVRFGSAMRSVSRRRSIGASSTTAGR